MLEFKLTQLVRSIPTSERNELFKMCSNMISARRDEGRTPKKIK
jgi:hypothetical protein